MKLINNQNLLELDLPNDLDWIDEFNWSPVQASNHYTITGALVIEQGVKQAGRPITLKSPEDGLGMVPRSTLATMRAWASIRGTRYTLKLERPADTRSFLVEFDLTGGLIEANPARGFTFHDPSEEFYITVRFIEVSAL